MLTGENGSKCVGELHTKDHDSAGTSSQTAQRVEKRLLLRRSTHWRRLRTRPLEHNGSGSGRDRAATCATDFGPRQCEATNLLMFCPAATMSDSTFTFSSILSLNLTIRGT